VTGHILTVEMYGIRRRSILECSCGKSWNALGLTPAELWRIEQEHLRAVTPASLGEAGTLVQVQFPFCCTGLTAMWCPLHGDCTCPDGEPGDDPGCPLHAPEAEHPL
jgi:hypothetical protein